MATEVSNVVREDLENECVVSLPLYCPILQPLGEEGPGETGGCCLATRGASGSMRMAGETPAPSLALFLISPSPAETWGGMPRAACLIRAESIEGIFRNEIVWPVEAAAPGVFCHPPQWVEGAYLSVQHTLPADNSWGGTSPPNFDFSQSGLPGTQSPAYPGPKLQTHHPDRETEAPKGKEIWSYSF